MRLIDKTYGPSPEREASLVRSLSALLELRDPLGGARGRLVAICCRRLGRRLGLDKVSLARLGRAAEIYRLDMPALLAVKGEGVRLPVARLTGKKPADDSLSREEGWLSALLSGIPYFEGCANILALRHRRYDEVETSGPTSNTATLLEARILAVVVAFFELMPSESASSKQEVLSRLQEEAGKLLDPVVVEAFRTMMLETGKLSDNLLVGMRPPLGEKLSVRTLGSPRISFGGSTLSNEDWRTQKALKLFLYLALRSKPILSDRLAEAIWPETTTKKSKDSLRNALHQLRKTVRGLLRDPQVSVVFRRRSEDTIGLELPCDFDFIRFESLVKESVRAWCGSQAEGAIELATQALEMYQGDFLEGFDDEWVRPYRDRLRELCWQALSTKSRALLSLGQNSQAEVVARELVELDDLREEAYALLVESLVAQGKRSLAAKTVRAALEHLERELGVSPIELELFENLTDIAGPPGLSPDAMIDF